MTDPRVQAVIDAASRLLEAREDGMVTAEEWDDLRRAVEACRTGQAQG